MYWVFGCWRFLIGVLSRDHAKPYVSVTKKTFVTNILVVLQSKIFLVPVSKILFSNTVSVDYRLHDPSDTSEYSSRQYFTDGAMNPCVDSTFDFFDKVMSTVKQYHAAASVPLKLMHLAGDEVASGAWINSTACSRLLEVSNAPQGELTLLLLNGILKVLVPFLAMYLCVYNTCHL